MHKILKLAIADAGVQDFFNFKLLVIVDDNGWCWILRTAGDVVGLYGLQERHMEHGMDSHRRRQLEAKRGSAHLVLDRERAETLVVELVAGASCLDVAAQEPHLIAFLERWSFLDLAIVEPRVGGRCFS